MSSSADKSCFVLITAFRAGSCGFSSLPVQDFKDDVEGERGIISPLTHMGAASLSGHEVLITIGSLTWPRDWPACHASVVNTTTHRRMITASQPPN